MKVRLYICALLVWACWSSVAVAEIPPIILATATWYDQPGLMANGKRFDPKDKGIVAGSKRFYGHRTRVCNPNNGICIDGTFVDRMRHSRNNRVDLTPAGIKALGLDPKLGRYRLTLLLLPE